MADFPLQNDKIATVGILSRDAAGEIVPAPAGDVFTVVSSNPSSLKAEISADANGKPTVVLTPLVQVSPGISVTVSDSAGLEAFTEVVDIVQDVAPKAIGLDIAGAVELDQPVPSAPGP